MVRTIRIQNLTLEPFKGVKTSLFFNGDNAEIKGKNGTGKTTIADAWLWLLTGKSFAGLTDSGRGAFSVLPIINAEQATSAEVSADITIDGEEIRLTRRIETSGKLKSKKTVFFFDDTEVSKTQFDDFIRDKFGVLDLRPFCVPGDFLAHDARWQRDVLLTSVKKLGEIEDVEIEDEEQATYAEIKKIGDFATWEKGKKNSIKDAKAAIAAIPERIKTAESLRPEPADYDAIEKELKGLSAQKPKTEMPEEWQIAIKKKEEIIKAFADVRAAALAKVNEAKMQFQNLSSQQRAAADSNAAYRNQLSIKKADLLRQLQSITDKRDELRAAFLVQRDQQRTPGDTSCVRCPLYNEITCENPLILANIEDAEKAAAAAFETAKQKKLDEINAEGKKLNEQLQEISDELARIEKELATPFVLPLQEELAKAAEIVKQYEAEVPTAPDTKELDAQIETFKKEATAITTDDTIRAEKIRALAAKLGEKEQVAKIDAQIAAIEKESEALQNALGEFEYKLALGQAIKRRQMQSLENAVNSHFDSNIRFALFEQQVNGDFADTCQLLIDGIPYGRGANRAAEINAALEICDFLQRGANISIPIFVDNAESVNNLTHVHSQSIRLRVTEDDELGCELLETNHD